MPLEQLDTSQDKKISAEELTKALHAGFFDKPDHLQAMGDYLSKEGLAINNTLLDTLKTEMVRQYIPAKARMEADRSIRAGGNSVGYYSVNQGQLKADAAVIKIYEQYEQYFGKDFFAKAKLAGQKELDASKSVTTANAANPTIQRQKQIKEAQEYVAKYDEVNDILHQFLSDDGVSITSVTWSEYAKHYPVDARQQQSMQVIAESTGNQRPAYLPNPTTGVLEPVKQHNDLTPPSNVVQLTIPAGGTMVVRVDDTSLSRLKQLMKQGGTSSSTNKKLIVLHTKDGATNNYYSLTSGKTLGMKNFATVSQRDDGTMDVVGLDGQVIRRISAQEARAALKADEMSLTTLNSKETQRAQSEMTALEGALQPLHAMWDMFNQSSLFSSSGNISPQQVEDTRVRAVSMLQGKNALVPYLEGRVSFRKQEQDNLKAMLSNLPPDSPMIGTQKSIADMIAAYDVLIEQCGSVGGKSSALRSFLEILTNPSTFSEITITNFLKNNSPMIVGAVIGAVVTIGSGGALLPIAGGVVLGMGLGRVAQIGINRSSLFDASIVVDGKKVVLDFNNPTDVEQYLAGKMSGKVLIAGLVQQFAQQFVMQILFAKGLQASQQYIHATLAKYPHGYLAKFLRIIKPQLPKLSQQYSQAIQRVGNKVTPLRTAGAEKTMGTAGEVVQEHREELTEEFMTHILKQTEDVGVGGYTVNFLIALYGGIKPRDRAVHQQALFSDFRMQETGLYKVGQAAVIQSLQVGAWDRIQELKNYYISQGFAYEGGQQSGSVVRFTKQHEVLDDAGQPRLDEMGNPLIASQVVELTQPLEATTLSLDEKMQRMDFDIPLNGGHVEYTTMMPDGTIAPVEPGTLSLEQAKECFMHGLEVSGKMFAGHTWSVLSSTSLFLHAPTYSKLPGDIDIATNVETFYDLAVNRIDGKTKLEQFVDDGLIHNLTFTTIGPPQKILTMQQLSQADLDGLVKSGNIRVEYGIKSKDGFLINTEFFPEPPGNGLIQLGTERTKGKITTHTFRGTEIAAVNPELAAKSYLINLAHEINYDTISGLALGKKLKHSTRVNNLFNYLHDAGIKVPQDMLSFIDNTIRDYRAQVGSDGKSSAYLREGLDGLITVKEVFTHLDRDYEIARFFSQSWGSKTTLSFAAFLEQTSLIKKELMTLDKDSASIPDHIYASIYDLQQSVDITDTKSFAFFYEISLLKSNFLSQFADYDASFIAPMVIEIQTTSLKDAAIIEHTLIDLVTVLEGNGSYDLQLAQLYAVSPELGQRVAGILDSSLSKTNKTHQIKKLIEQYKGRVLPNDKPNDTDSDTEGGDDTIASDPNKETSVNGADSLIEKNITKIQKVRGALSSLLRSKTMSLDALNHKFQHLLHEVDTFHHFLHTVSHIKHGFSDLKKTMVAKEFVMTLGVLMDVGMHIVSLPVTFLHGVHGLAGDVTSLFPGRGNTLSLLQHVLEGSGGVMKETAQYLQLRLQSFSLLNNLSRTPVTNENKEAISAAYAEHIQTACLGLPASAFRSLPSHAVFDQYRLGLLKRVGKGVDPSLQDYLVYIAEQISLEPTGGHKEFLDGIVPFLKEHGSMTAAASNAFDGFLGKHPSGLDYEQSGTSIHISDLHRHSLLHDAKGILTLFLHT